MSDLHSHYMNPSKAFERITAADIRQGDRIWLRAPDGFDPWYQPLHVDEHTVCGQDGDAASLVVSYIGTSGQLLSLRHDKWGNRRYVYPSAPVYRIPNP